MMISASNGTSNTNKSLTLLTGGWKPHNMLSQLKRIQKIMHMIASLQYYVLPMGWFLCPQQDGLSPIRKEVCTGRLQQHQRRRYDDNNDDDGDDDDFFPDIQIFRISGRQRIVCLCCFSWRSWFFRNSGHRENLRIVSFSWIPRFFFLNFRTPQNSFVFIISPGCDNFQNLQASPNRLVYVCVCCMYVCMHRKMPMDPMAMPRDPMCECVNICYNM